ncbi:probable protein high chlorophyll fluorescent 107 [Coccomyxa sp. Obi]|nr:probable protein high chlorophyll fluorescent 107 [Coccomyxa sp. Obi]
MQRQHQKGSYVLRHNGPSLRGFSGDSSSCSTRCSALYAAALQLARSQDYVRARDAFQRCVELCPDFTKAWVSWAQLEKRVKLGDGVDHVERCRCVLQRGLTLNPKNASLCQAWGLMELQRGNVVAAVLLLERCVAYDPRCSPVLKWKAVRIAQQTVTSRRRRSLSELASGDLSTFA